jgi:dihydrofolate reductase
MTPSHQAKEAKATKAPTTTTTASPARPGRRLLVTEFVSLDGVAEDPRWTFPYWNDAIAAFKQEETDRCDALLLGRVTYEQFAQAWPHRKDDPGAAYFNGVRKHVVSTTRTEDIWQNATFLPGDLRKAIGALKAAPGRDIAVHGSITLARTLLREGLVDELRLLVYPLVLGKGRRLFDGPLPGNFQLIRAEALEKGVVALVYRTTPQEEKA